MRFCNAFSKSFLAIFYGLQKFTQKTLVYGRVIKKGVKMLLSEKICIICIAIDVKWERIQEQMKDIEDAGDILLYLRLESLQLFEIWCTVLDWETNQKVFTNNSGNLFIWN